MNPPIYFLLFEPSLNGVVIHDDTGQKRLLTQNFMLSYASLIYARYYHQAIFYALCHILTRIVLKCKSGNVKVMQKV